MKKYVYKTITHPLISGSSIIFIGSLMGSLLNFLFNLFMTRNFSVSDYGILASLISIMTLSSLPAGSFAPVVVNFSASYFAKNELDKVRALFLKITLLSGSLGLIIFLFFILFSKAIGVFFNIQNSSLVIATSLIIFLGYIGSVNSAILQAKLSFIFLSGNSLLGAFLKFAIGVILVVLGFGLYGPILAILFSFFISYIVSFIPLQFLFKKEANASNIGIKEIIHYGAPAGLAMLGLTSLITTDIILAKHFFMPKDAGIYAGLSLVGRVIFFLTAPITTVMFPMIVQRYTRQEGYHNVFGLSLILVLIPSCMLTLFYFLFPEFAITFFIKNKEYLITAPLLGYFGIFITIYSVLSIIVNFYLSINKTWVAIPIIATAILQIVLMYFYHQSFIQIILISIVVTSLLVAVLLLYYCFKLYEEKRKN